MTLRQAVMLQVRVDGLEKWSPSGHKGADKRDVVFDSQLEFILPGSIANNRQERVVLEVQSSNFSVDVSKVSLDGFLSKTSKFG